MMNNTGICVYSVSSLSMLILLKDYIFRAKNIQQSPSLPNTFSLLRRGKVHEEWVTSHCAQLFCGQGLHRMLCSLLV
jgi:hypothetical protein